MKQINKLIVLLFLVTLITLFCGCVKKSPDSSDIHSQDIAENQDVEDVITLSSENSEIINSDNIDDNVDVSGTIDNIIVEEKEYTLYLSDEYDFNAPNSTTKPIFPAVVLTNSQVQSVPPTLVREGDTFLGWKAMSVEAGYIYYDDGRMYPQYGSGVIVEFEGELTIKAQFDYFNDYEKVNFENDGLFITPTSEYQELFPMVYNEGKGYITTFCAYGLDGMGWDEIRELLNYKHGIYECEVTIRDYKLNRVPVGGRFNMATIVDMSVLSLIENHTYEESVEVSENIITTKEFYPIDLPDGEKEAVSFDTLQKIEGKWYYYPDSEWTENGRMYIFSFSPDKKEMMWVFAYMNSESINTYEGHFEFESQGVITATLNDEIHGAIYDNVFPVNLTLYVEYMKDNTYKMGAHNIIIVTIQSCDNEFYSDLVGLSIPYEGIS